MFVAPEVMKEAKKLARDKYLACLFLANADKHRYEAVVNDLHNNFVKWHTSTYPTTLDAAYAYLDISGPWRLVAVKSSMPHPSTNKRKKKNKRKEKKKVLRSYNEQTEEDQSNVLAVIRRTLI